MAEMCTLSGTCYRELKGTEKFPKYSFV